MMNTTEVTLIKQVLSGNQEFYRPLVEKYQQKIFVLAYSLLRNSSEAQDLSQEAFLMAFKKLRELKDQKKFGSWLYGITRNLCYEALRKKHVETDSLDEVPPAKVGNVISMRGVDDPNEEMLRTMMKKLESMPEKYRILLHLKYLKDLTYQEISEMLDLSVDLVRSRLFEGRRLLREGVEQEWREEHGF